ncbi:Subtilase family protein [Methylobacterium sp. ap11]|uniref:S8 family peptidase n=1 Tax=Methylobacterium sp. ap11 TaxID=1761799 RepID=UPI0008ABCE65|nr:S8 family serine peptidase [Methylobacterium sp. ap11]SEO45605.1 Subtilase family protein [Methylobacterium sp. ap11]
MTNLFSQADILTAGSDGTGVLLVPKSAFDPDSVVTPSRVAAYRTSPSARQGLGHVEETAARRLERLGLQEVATSDLVAQPTVPLSETQGVFARFTSLGLTAAYFRDERRIAAARGALQDDFEVVTNFSLALPTRLRAPGARLMHATSMPVGTGWPTASGIDTAHRQNVRGAGVLVGVLDTGIDADHQQFHARTIPFRYVSFDPNNPASPPRDVRGFDLDGHGTHVCGIIAGSTVGVAPEAELMVASVIESETARTSLIRVVYGLNWLLQEFTAPANAIKPAVVNLSLGFPSTGVLNVPLKEYRTRLRAMEAVLNLLIQANVLPIVAIGNDGPGRFGYPGGFRNALGVGAVDHNGIIAPFSGSRTSPRTRKPDIYGYGVGIYSSLERDMANQSFYGPLDGTSMAAPFVAGIAALYLSRSRMSASALRTALLANAQTVKTGRRSALIARYV